MASTSQQPKEREKTLSTLNALIEGLNLAKEIATIAPAKAAFGSVSVLLAMIRVRSPSFYDAEFLANVHLGLYGQRAGLRRSWGIMC